MTAFSIDSVGSVRCDSWIFIASDCGADASRAEELDADDGPAGGRLLDDGLSSEFPPCGGGAALTTELPSLLLLAELGGLSALDDGSSDEDVSALDGGTSLLETASTLAGTASLELDMSSLEVTVISDEGMSLEDGASLEVV